MLSTLDTFSAQKQSALALLSELEAFLEQGQALGITISPALRQQLAQSQQALADARLRIVLIGGFSEGKTALAAAWLGRLEDGVMQISQRESSDAIQRYAIDEQIELVDTPGLFGFKQRFDPDTQTLQAYRDTTRNYASAAHVVLYVMNAGNPVKPSHAEELQWLFRSLNLLPRTVFVLGRFDEVADLEDEQDYQDKLAVKRDDICAQLTQMLQLSAEEQAALRIVAVSANPFNLGVAHWLAHPAQFRALSHLDTLHAATAQTIAANGGPLALAQAMQRSLLNDLMQRQLPQIQAGAAQLHAESERLLSMQLSQQAQVQRLLSEIEQARLLLGQQISRHFEDLILQAKGTTPETFQAFYHREIGADAALLRQQVQGYFLHAVRDINDDLKQIQIRVAAGVDHYNQTVAQIGKQGLQYLTNSNLINTQNLLAARDGIQNIARHLGMDLGQSVIMRSLGAANLAKGLNGLLSVVGLALEVWDTWQQAQRRQAFQAAIAQLCDELSAVRRQLLDSVEAPDFDSTYFPGLAPLQTQLDSVSQTLASLHQRLQRFEAWRQHGQALASGVSAPAAPTPAPEPPPPVQALAPQTDGAAPSPTATTPPETIPFWRRWLS